MHARTLLPLLMLAAACDMPQNAVTPGPGGTSLIQVQDGMNCMNNRCFRLDTAGRRVQLAGRRPARVPAGIDVSRGAVTTGEFQRMFQAASVAYSASHGR